jgi:hypothetical protein
MDMATQREDMNGLSSVANMRQKREQRERDRIDRERREKQAEEGKRRSKTVAVGLAYSPLFQTYRDQ